MNESSPSPLSAEDQVRAAIGAQSHTALLLNFTATWCQPCKSFAPVLSAVEQLGEDQIRVLKVDIDKMPDITRQFNVRSVPTTILLKNGAEQDRFVGGKSRNGLAAWLHAREVKLDLANPAAVQADTRNAFHGDPNHKQSLLERLYRHIDAGDVERSFMPFWTDGRGSVSAALVEDSEPEAFELATGMSYGVAAMLEFLDLDKRADAELIFNAIAPGADTSLVALHFVRAWLAGSLLDWPGALASKPHDDLRRDWLQISGEQLAGKSVDAARWTTLRNAAKALIAEGDPYHMLENDLAMLVEQMSPPPPGNDADGWRSILLGRTKFARARLIEYRSGWSKLESAQPDLRNRWFKENVPIDADGRIDQQVLKDKRTEWERNNAEFFEKEKKLYKHYAELSEEINRPFQDIAVDILRNCNRPKD